MDKYLRLITNKISSIPINSAIQKEGDEHCVLEINNEWIFRFAKNDQIKRAMTQEIAILNALENKITYAIPKVVYYFPQEYCFGYRTIDSMPLTKAQYHIFSLAQKKHFIQDFAQFLHEVHCSLSVEKAQLMGLLKADWPLKSDQLFQKLHGNLDELQTAFDRFIIRYQQIEAIEPRMLVHNDLHTDNILIDPATKKLGGIIDFTSAAIDTAYHDFRYLHLIDEKLVALVIQAYNQISLHTLIARDAYIYCMATEFSRLSESLTSKDMATATEIKDRITSLQNYL